MRYAVWNNKGGVGKSFLSFMMATEWAHQNPDARVLVVDMCPQANVSEMLLGGNGGGHSKLMELIGSRKTIGSYFDTRISSPHSKTGDEKNSAIIVSDYNKEIPSNLYLVAGDPSLELQVQTINNIAVQELPLESWKNVHLWVRDLIDGIIDEKFEGRPSLCIIDCNPSFASYTEQALLAAERLIVPCSPDGSSARAITNLARLIYGIDVPKEYENVGFSSKVEQFKMKSPTPHMILFNRSTTYNKEPSNAFKAMFKQIREEVSRFIPRLPTSCRPMDIGDDIFLHMPDSHTPAVVASSKGMPLYKLTPGQVELPDKTITQLNGQSLANYKQKMQDVVDRLVLE